MIGKHNMESTLTNNRKYIPWFLIIAFAYNVLIFAMQLIMGGIKSFLESLIYIWWHPGSGGASFFDYFLLVIYLGLTVTACILMYFAYKKRSKKMILLTALLLIIKTVIIPWSFSGSAATIFLLFFAILDLDDQEVSDSGIYKRSKDLKLNAIYLYTCFSIVFRIFLGFYDIDSPMGKARFILVILWGIAILILVRYSFTKMKSKLLLAAIVLIATWWFPNILMFIEQFIEYGSENYFETYDGYDLEQLLYGILTAVLNPLLALSIAAYIQAKNMDRSIETKEWTSENISYTPHLYTRWFMEGSRRRIIKITLIITLAIPLSLYIFLIIMDSIG